ncbi:MAG: hypothetical protein WCG93_16615 [Paludibacter sp.]
MTPTTIAKDRTSFIGMSNGGYAWLSLTKSHDSCMSDLFNLFTIAPCVVNQ